MLHQRTRLLGSIFGLATAGALLAGCGGAPQPTAPPAEQPSSPGQTQAASPKQTSGTYEPYRPGATAITYDPAQVPPGSSASITSERTDGRTRVTVEVRGLQPNREYGAHVHTKPCGPTGEDAGPHFQERADPVKPSVDPAYANPQNEVWLDFHTDAQGNGTATAEGNWSFDTRQDAKSFVVHATHTHTEPGQAGTAGARLACLDAQF
ncbi:superoxide dismutase family protein [Saccharopolyspora sp. 5N708]|uniref:superoxide dismutase family protein n=1 Tax=Saccharopolyspora sp. 5N708 TaxID=3457424 RepID=UPI003FD36A3B